MIPAIASRNTPIKADPITKKSMLTAASKPAVTFRPIKGVLLNVDRDTIAAPLKKISNIELRFS